MKKAMETAMRIGPKLPMTAWRGCIDVGCIGQLFGGSRTLDGELRVSKKIPLAELDEVSAWEILSKWFRRPNLTAPETAVPENVFIYVWKDTVEKIPLRTLLFLRKHGV